MKSTATLALTLLFAGLTACSNPGELRRQELRDQTTQLAENSKNRPNEIRRNTRILEGLDQGRDSAMMRWQAAQNIGTLRAEDQIELLLRKGISITADDSANVRRECVLALGHMPIKSALDEKRRELVSLLAGRLVQTRESFVQSFLTEDDGQVRLALVATLITFGLPARKRGESLPRIGFQDVANALYSIASTFSSETAPGDERVNAAVVERCLGGLELICGVAAKDWKAARKDLDQEDYVEWWSKPVSNMPRLVDYSSSKKVSTP